ncbi:ferredoxin [Candidatus Gottesmanbacteria bacterium]|nr:ferredoxin [Candidatus Gottesmanbacteria bacterium]MBI5465132.1 ferredoxin [Candidatus Gottesmanbacteria bacterium]
MKILVIDKDTCIGCGTCVALCAKVFKLSDDGKAEVIDQNADTAENIQNAIDSCPVAAIKWEDK